MKKTLLSIAVCAVLIPISRNALAQDAGLNGTINPVPDSTQNYGNMALEKTEQLNNQAELQAELLAKQALAKQKTIDQENKALAEVVEKAFRNAKTEELILSPDQIKQYKSDLDITEQAIMPSPAPKMINRSQNVTLEPGAEAINVKLAPGYTSSILVIDSTGEPWPITSVTIGNDKWFSIKRPETEAKNLLTINPLKNHVTSNLVVTLQNEDAPLIIHLNMNDNITDKAPQEADMVVSMRMNKPGPKAAAPIVGAKLDNTISSELMSFLDGVPSQGSQPQPLKDAPEGVSAWDLKGQLYVRTPYPIRWPAHIQQASSTSGVRVYVMPMTNSLLLSVNGSSHRVTVKR